MKRDITNEIVNVFTHGVGFFLSIAGLVVLVRQAVLSSEVWHIVSFSVFGASLILAYGASAFYHGWPYTKRAKKFLNRFDHAMIYVLIAGTYTPITFVPLRGGWGWSIFGIVWGFALIGIVWKLADWYLPCWLSGVIYLFLGWIIIIAIVPLLHAISWPAFGWLLAGGLSYSIGFIFFGLEARVKPRRWFGMHEIFHLFVMGGSFCHWWLMFEYV